MMNSKGKSTLLGRVEENNLTSMAYKRIRNAIINGEFKAGECLSSPQLAKSLNMSRTPVREALNILASEGFVDIQNGVGILVKDLTKKDIIELYEVRIALECIALETLIATLNKNVLNTIKKLEQGWLKLKQKFETGKLSNMDEVLLLDYKTHDFIVRGSNNSFLIELIENIKLRIMRAQYLSVVGLNDVANTIDQHLELLSSIKNGRVEESTHNIKQHIRESVSYICLNTEAVNKLNLNLDNLNSTQEEYDL